MGAYDTDLARLYEPPALTDTSFADAAFHAAAHEQMPSLDPLQVNAFHAAVKAAYAAGWKAAMIMLMGGVELTQEDLMAFDGSYTQCGNNGGWMDCNRAVGHIGEHAMVTDDDRSGADLSPLGIAIGYHWPRESYEISICQIHELGDPSCIHNL